VNIAVEGRCLLTPGDSAYCRFLALSAEQFRPQDRAAGHTDEEVDQTMAPRVSSSSARSAAASPAGCTAPVRPGGRRWSPPRCPASLRSGALARRHRTRSCAAISLIGALVGPVERARQEAQERQVKPCRRYCRGSADWSGRGPTTQRRAPALVERWRPWCGRASLRQAIHGGPSARSIKLRVHGFG
jgi:hypothetical protein